MRIILKTLICLCSALILANMVDAKEWRGIVPMHSTRADVERLLGLPPNGYYGYDLPNERVVFEFSERPCDPSNVIKWDVPPWTVTAISVKPRIPQKLADLKLDFSKFRKRPDVPIPSEPIYYDSIEEGFSLIVAGEAVTGYIYSADPKDKHLRCPSPPTVFLDCDQVSVTFTYPKGPVVAGQSVTITARVETTNPYFLSQTYYYWKTNPDLDIISGQGETQLVIDTTGLEGRTVKVGLYLGSTPERCWHTCEFKVINWAQKNGRLKKSD